MEKNKKVLDLFEKILSFGEEFLTYLFGEKGPAIYNFSLKVNKKHNDLDCLLINECDLFLELITLAKYAFDSGLNLAFENIKSNIKKLKIDLNSISLHEDSFRHVRFLEKESRKKARSLKRSWKFCSKFFSENLKTSLIESPDDIKFFYPKNIHCIEELDKLKQQRNRFQNINFSEYAALLDKKINILKSKEYKEFKQIEMPLAFAILAKMNFVSIDNFQPTVYSFFEFEHLASDEVLQLINKVENQDSPFFDFYLILVCSFKGDDLNSDKEKLLDKNIRSFVLGEKDGECYFICDWKSKE